MKYRLNKLPVKTTNNFKINDIEIDLDIPKEGTFKNFNIDSLELDNIKIEVTTRVEKISSRIGLEFNKYLDINIFVYKYTSIKNPIILTYEFSDNDVLIDNINITYEESSSADFIIKYKSIDEGCHFHHLKECVCSMNNSRGSISIINMMNDSSINLIAVENDVYDNSCIKHNLIDLGGSVRLYNTYINTIGYASENYFNNIYIGNNNSIIDMNYNLRNIGKKSINNLKVEGALDGKSKKNFRGTIDFLEGSTNSVGVENENCVLLSNTCRSRSLPMLLCHEENVVGSHGESSGKVSKDKLFYLMSRGFSEKEAERLIIVANFTSIINEIPNENLKEEILNIIEEKVK